MPENADAKKIGATRRQFLADVCGLTIAGAIPLSALRWAAAAAAPPPAGDLAFAGAAELTRLLGRKELRAEDLTRLYLDRIESTKQLNAYVKVLSGPALARAKELDALAARGAPRGPLHGLGIALKDDLRVSGLPLTLGSRVMGDWAPPDDATAVRKLRDAGAVILGKTNLDEFTLGLSGRNSRFGQTRNPHAPDRIPGGSSAGSAAAVAAGLCVAALGSDASGSVRIPASLCGVVGFKPTLGAVSRHGLTPIVPTKDVLSVLARSVRDAALVARVLSGRDALDPTTKDAPAWKEPDFSRATLKGARIGYLAAFGTDPAVRAVSDAAVEKLRGLGASVSVVEPFPAKAMQQAATFINAVEFRTWIEIAVRHARPDISDEELLAKMDPLTSRLYQVFGKTSAREYCKALLLDRPELVRFYSRLLGEHTLLVQPTVGVLPFGLENADTLASESFDTLKERYGYLRRNAEISGMTGFPAISVPAGYSAEGIPVGVELIAAPYADARLLEAAAALEGAAKAYKKPAHL